MGLIQRQGAQFGRRGNRFGRRREDLAAAWLESRQSSRVLGFSRWDEVVGRDEEEEGTSIHVHRLVGLTYVNYRDFLENFEVGQCFMNFHRKVKN